MKKYFDARLNKLLSIILCGRNDNYLGDFKYRIQTSVNYAGLNCARLGIKDEVEILIVDWNSDKPLSQTLNLLLDAYDVCRYISVPPDLIQLHYPNKRVFNPDAAVNVGLRRASGQYALFIPADILITESTLYNLIAILKRERKTIFDPATTAMSLDRKMLPWQIVEKKPTLMEWDRYIQLCSRHLLHDRSFIGLNGGYGGLLLHRNLWQECQGFVEDNTGWGATDTDWGLRLSQKYLSVTLESFGVMLYDMDQKPELRAQIKGGTFNYKNCINRDNPQWGMNEIILEQSIGVLKEDISFPKELPIRPRPETSLNLIQQAYERILPNLPGIEKLPQNSIEYVLLASLAWYCITYWPSRYFEFNSHVGSSTLAYAKLCPFGEIYTYEDYDTDSVGDFHYYRNTLPHMHFYWLGFQGHAQVLTGNSETLMDRLRNSFPGNLELDIAILRCDVLKTPERCINMLDALMEVLTINGALFITAQSLELFNSLHIHLIEKYSRHYFMHLPEQPFILFIKAGH